MRFDPIIQKVLLVDDGEVDNFIHQKMLERANFADEIVTTTSAEDGLAYLRDHLDWPPQLIFLDINMPAMDGFGFIQEYHKFPEPLKSSCRIVVLSSSLDEDEIKRITESRYVSDFFSKPLNENMLSELQWSLQQVRKR